MGHLRSIARPIVARVIAENSGEPLDEIKKALFHAYPFGERKRFPYKVWLSEIKEQLPKTKPDEVPENQTSFFEI